MANEQTGVNAASGSGEDSQTQNIGNMASSLPKAYILSSGDHPGLSLTSIPLTGPNYMLWKHDIITSLMAK